MNLQELEILRNFNKPHRTTITSAYKHIFFCGFHQHVGLIHVARIA
jgi:hypothetical protein